jgi:hypothetical protein
MYHRLKVYVSGAYEGGNILGSDEKTALEKASQNISSGYYADLFPGCRLSFELVLVKMSQILLQDEKGRPTLWYETIIARFDPDGTIDQEDLPFVRKRKQFALNPWAGLTALEQLIESIPSTPL